jgi:predicted transcriptional regulator
LTENGITRWLAHYVSKEMSMVELNDVPVRQVLPEEEKRPNCLFVARDKTVDEAKALFATKELLEAVLITQSGNRTEKLIGIITRWDVLHEG